MLVDGRAVLFLERGGRSLLPLVAPDDPAVGPALAAGRRGPRGPAGPHRLERVDGEDALSGPWADRLVSAGFRRGPRRLHADRDPSPRRELERAGVGD